MTVKGDGWTLSSESSIKRRCERGCVVQIRLEVRHIFSKSSTLCEELGEGRADFVKEAALQRHTTILSLQTYLDSMFEEWDRAPC